MADLPMGDSEPRPQQLFNAGGAPSLNSAANMYSNTQSIPPGGVPYPVPGLATNHVRLGGATFSLPERYVAQNVIGSGAYGMVISAQDRVTGTVVAIKKIANLFSDLQDTKRILREIRLMRHFAHENVLPLVDVFVTAPRDLFHDIYLVSPLMETNLENIITSPQTLSGDHIQYFVYQILRGLKAVHSAHVLHRDLKPANLILNGDCQLRLCDFGLARVANPEDDWNAYLTEYVATRWYRAPEVILSWKQYTKAIDVWSVGCIMAELLGRRPLFPGADYAHQIMAITDVLGTPPEAEIERIGEEAAQRYLRSLGPKEKRDFAVMFPEASVDALDLLNQLLQFDPELRATVDEALAHPYFTGLHDPADEPAAPAIFDFDFEGFDLSTQDFRNLLWKEMLDFHPECEGWYEA